MTKCRAGLATVAHDTHPRIFAVLELFFWICPTSCKKYNGPSLTINASMLHAHVRNSLWSVLTTYRKFKRTK